MNTMGDGTTSGYSLDNYQRRFDEYIDKINKMTFRSEPAKPPQTIYAAKSNLLVAQKSFNANYMRSLQSANSAALESAATSRQILASNIKSKKLMYG